MIENAMEAYDKARRMGEREASRLEHEYQDPYLPVLNDILAGKKTAGIQHVGVKDLPTHLIVGTKTAGRHEAFARNFMPLLPVATEFGNKWVRLYQAQLDEGIHDPVKAYEYLNKYYVEEGNKRVSVLKFLDSPTITADITRVLPVKDDSPESTRYYEQLHFSEISGQPFMIFRKASDYRKLTQILGLPYDKKWSEEDAEALRSLYIRFLYLFRQKGGLELRIRPAVAFMMFMELYGDVGMTSLTPEMLEKSMTNMWDDFVMWPEKRDKKLETTGDEEGRKKLLNLRFEPLKVAFVYSRTPDTSSWTARHEGARRYVEDQLKGEVRTRAYLNADTPEEEMKVLEQAVADGNEVIFTTSPAMLRSSLKIAAKYPKLKIINCSLNDKTGHVRTYYGRTFEIQFLNGMIAGILTKNDRIGYVADYPLYGSIANINAFAMGARMVNPNVKIVLDWSTTKTSMPTTSNLAEPDITYISGQEFDPNVHSTKEYGLYDSRSGKFLNLAHIVYYWGEFYEKMLKMILKGGWKATPGESVSYWWGLSNHLLDIYFTDEMPTYPKRLIEIMKSHMSEGGFNLFCDELKDQSGKIRNEEYACLSPENVMYMDWLLENVEGQIPSLDDFTEDAQRVVSLHGLAKVKQLPEPDKEETGADHE